MDRTQKVNFKDTALTFSMSILVVHLNWLFLQKVKPNLTQNSHEHQRQEERGLQVPEKVNIHVWSLKSRLI